MFTTHSEAAFGWSVTKAAQRPLDVAHDGDWRWNRPGNGRNLPGLSTADPVIRCEASSEPLASNIRDRTPVYQRFPDSLSLGWATFLYVIKRRRLRRRLAALACALGPAVRPLEALHRR